MILHTELGKSDFGIKRQLKIRIDTREICLGGNKTLKIYGTLTCKSGKRMKIKNRVFFSSKKEAIQEGFRPCGHCMKEQYNIWKATTLNPDSKTSP